MTSRQAQSGGSIYDTMYVADIGNQPVEELVTMLFENINIYDAAQTRSVKLLSATHVIGDARERENNWINTGSAE